MLTTICLALLVSSPQSTDWPQYRGPDGTGAGPAQSLAVQGRDEPLWSTNVGAGYSCPSIADDRLVTIGYDEAAGVDRIVCLAAETGVEHWKFEFASTDEPQYHLGGTLTTPTIRAGLVYCLNRSGKFHVLDLETGELVWSRDYMVELELDKTFHGFSASPLLAGEQILLQMGGRVVAVDASDGSVLWQSEEQGDASYSNLAKITVDDKAAVAGVQGETFFVFGLTDGEVLREVPWTLAGNAVHCATPIPVGEGRIFLSSAYGKGCELLDLSTQPPTSVWGNRNMRNKVTACVLNEGNLYGFDESMLRCVDLDGNSKWRERGLGLGSLSIVGDRLLILNSDGELIIAEATPEEYRELSRRKVLDGGVYWTMPVAVDGLIYVRNSLGDLRCLDYRPRTVPSLDGAEITSKFSVVPEAAALFLKHSEHIGGDEFNNSDKALRLRGTWAIPLRGLEASEMSLTLVAPDRWDLRLDEGGLLYTYDGERSWAIEPQGPRMVEGEELFEGQRLFALPTLFAPSCPKGAEVRPHPTRFAETECWQVSAPLAARDGGEPGRQYHYFDLETGALVGSEGDGLSTLVFHGSQSLDGLTLPTSMTRYRAEDGQEHTLVFTAASWIETPTDLFELPAGIQRLLRSPEEIERDNTALRQRFAGALAAYKPQDKDTPLEDDIIELQVHDGELWFVTPEPEFRIDVGGEEDGVFPIDGPPLRISLEIGQDGKATVLRIHMPGPGGERIVLCDRLPA
ncbi:MAG: outer membrane protein assembly factor BamB [Planctomycetota bacterium]|jgi:outer membrane protein assembly factor BamB